MNILPAVGIGLLFLYVAKGNKIKKKKGRKAIVAGSAVYNFDDLPDGIEADVGEKFTIQLRQQPGFRWDVKATPPNNEVSFEDMYQDDNDADAWYYEFKAKKPGKGSLVFHLLNNTDKPQQIIEILIEVV